MRIDRQEVERIARLARIDLPPRAVERFREQLETILDHVARLDDLAVDDTRPTTQPLVEHPALRSDEPHSCLTRDEALAGAPDAESGLFRVPRVLDTP